MTVHDKDGRIVRYGLLFDWNWNDFLDFYGAKVFSPDGTHCTIDSPAGIRAMQTMYDLVYKYHAAPSPAEQAAMATTGGWGSGSISWFGAKRGAMALGGRWWLATLRNYKGLDLGVAEAPSAGFSTYSGYGRATLVNLHSKHLAGALDFIRYLASPGYNHLINAQADAITAFKQYSHDPDLLHDPAHPNEHDNDVWVAATARGVADRTTPFLDGATVTRIINKHLELMEDNQKGPEQALHDARSDIEDAMRDSLAENPAAAAQYRNLTGRDGP
jgi:multiple sugar transport system substrate-binding protein